MALPALLLAGVILWPATASGASRHTNPLPPGARVLASRTLPGPGHARAVVYRSGGVHLAVITGSGAGERVTWSRGLPQPRVSMDTPGPDGLFRVVVRSGHTRTSLFAYVFRSSRVVSAISGDPAGRLNAPEGLDLRSNGFTVQLPDAQHRGSVLYRWVDTYSWIRGSYRRMSHTYEPDYASDAYPTPSGVIRNDAGDTILIRLQVADTEQERETGLMHVHSLDPDSGMIFVWTSPVHDSFWMENTYIPLTVAFLAPDGMIQEMQDMAALSTSLHTPQKSYEYAIEANLGFFADHGIRVGDRVQLNLPVTDGKLGVPSRIAFRMNP